MKLLLYIVILLLLIEVLLRFVISKTLHFIYMMSLMAMISFIARKSGGKQDVFSRR